MSAIATTPPTTPPTTAMVVFVLIPLSSLTADVAVGSDEESVASACPGVACVPVPIVVNKAAFPAVAEVRSAMIDVPTSDVGAIAAEVSTADAEDTISATEVEPVVLISVCCCRGGGGGGGAAVVVTAAAVVVVSVSTGATAGGIAGAAACVVVACTVVDVEGRAIIAVGVVEVDVDAVEDVDVDVVDVELDEEDEELDVDVDVDVDVAVDVVPPPPPTLFALGIAVHLFPPKDVIKAPAGRLAFVAMVTVLQMKAIPVARSREC